MKGGRRETPPFTSRRVLTILFGAFAGTRFVLLELSGGNNNLFYRGHGNTRRTSRKSLPPRYFTMEFRRLFRPHLFRRPLSRHSPFARRFCPFHGFLLFSKWRYKSRPGIIPVINRLVTRRDRGNPEMDPLMFPSADIVRGWGPTACRAQTVRFDGELNYEASPVAINLFSEHVLSAPFILSIYCYTFYRK